MAVGLTATILGSRQSAAAMAEYALIGAVGSPIFLGFSGGVQVITGPTGGYIIGFIAAVAIIGIILEKTCFTIPAALVANTAGMFVTLFFGTIWLKIHLNFNWNSALAAGFYPFLIGGFVKAFLASWIGIKARRRLTRISLLSDSLFKAA